MSENTDKASKLELKPAEVAAGAGAAVVTAFASSALGVAGTLIGAAFASVLATVSLAVLRRPAERADESLRRTNGRLRQVAVRVSPSAAPAPAASAGSAATPATGSAETSAAGSAESLAATTGSAAAPATGTWASPGATGSERSADGRRPSAAGPGAMLRRRWVAITAGTVAAFVIALIAITGVESAIGKPLASLFGRDSSSGTSVGRVVDGGDRSADPSDEGQDPSPASTPAPTAEDPAASTAPAPASPTPVDATGSSAPASPDPTPSSPAAPTPSPSGPPTSPQPSP